MQDVNLTLLWPILVLDLILAVVALIDLGKRDVSRVRGEMKWVWVLAVLFIQPIGSIVYLIVGRKD